MTHPATLDTSTPHSARTWNYWLGGKDNFPADRAAGNAVVAAFPEIKAIARESRHLLTRVVRHLAADQDVRQFLDVGVGLPWTENVHDVAQQAAPESRVVYVDNDPMALVHARALLVGTPEGATGYVDADVRDPEKVLEGAAETLDFDRPVALLAFGVMGHVVDDEQARAIVRHLVDGLPRGSYLALNDGTASKLRTAAQSLYENAGGPPYRARTPEQMERFFDDLELLEPGVVSTPLWRPEPGGTVTLLDSYCGVARK